MQIQFNNTSYTPQFKALHIANAGELSLYKLTDAADRKYLKTLIQKVKTGDLMPNLSRQESERWDEMLEYAVYNAQSPDNITYLETHNNKPCGIITFWPSPGTTKLDCICTFPTEVGKKVKLAGKTLFYQLFKDFINHNGKKIELEAITNGPFDVVSKYENLGFKRTSKVMPTKTVMDANNYKIKETFKKLSEIIDYTPIEPERINLANILN